MFNDFTKRVGTQLKPFKRTESPFLHLCNVSLFVSGSVRD